MKLTNVNSVLFENCIQSITHSKEIINRIENIDMVDWAMGDDWGNPINKDVLNYESSIVILRINKFITIARSIPILLVNEDTMIDTIRSMQLSYQVDLNYETYQQNSTELLGVYTTFPFEQIIICPERIQASGFDFDALFNLVVLHELIHAVFKTKDRSEYSFWMEESLANFLALKLLKFYSKSTAQDSIYKIAKSFVDQQFGPYKFALEFYNLDITELIAKWISKDMITGYSQFPKALELKAQYLKTVKSKPFDLNCFIDLIDELTSSQN